MSLSEDVFYNLKLIRSHNVGPRTFHSLLEVFGSAKNALAHFHSKTKFNFVAANDDEIHKEIEQTLAYGAELVSYNDARYPFLLKQIHDFPPIITAKGNIELLSNSKL